MVDSAKIPLLRQFKEAPSDLSYGGNISVYTTTQKKIGSQRLPVGKA